MLNQNKVKLAIIGTNFITDIIIEASRFEPRLEIAALYSRTEERAKEYALKHSIPETFTCLETMAKSENINAVYIASPNSCHYEQSLLFMKNGKHIFCEKPLASNAREAKIMIESAKENKVVLMEAMRTTVTPNFSSLKENLHKVGKIRRYFSSLCKYSFRYDEFKNGKDINTFKIELSAGALMDIGVYTIYPMVVLFGKPNKIQASGVKLSTGVDGQGEVNFDYGEMSASIIYGKISDSSLPTEIQGESGTISVDKIMATKKITFKPKKGESEDLTREDVHHEYYHELAEFADLIEKGELESKVNSHENSLIVMEIMDEIRKQIGVVFPADL